MLNELKTRPYHSAFTLIVLLAAVLWLTGCSTPVDGARTLLDRLEFDEGEYGIFEMEGTVDLNPLPMFSTNVHLRLEKIKDKPGQIEEVAP